MCQFGVLFLILAAVTHPNEKAGRNDSSVTLFATCYGKLKPNSYLAQPRTLLMDFISSIAFGRARFTPEINKRFLRAT